MRKSRVVPYYAFITFYEPECIWNKMTYSRNNAFVVLLQKGSHDAICFIKIRVGENTEVEPILRSNKATFYFISVFCDSRCCNTHRDIFLNLRMRLNITCSAIKL